MKLKSRIKHPLTLLKMYMNEIEPIVMEEEENMMVPENKEVENPPIAETEYRTRHGRVVLKPERYRDTEKAYAVIREIYQKYLASSDSVHGDFFDSEFRASTSILYQDVLKKQPIDAKAAFKKEIKRAERTEAAHNDNVQLESRAEEAEEMLDLLMRKIKI